EPPVAIGPAYQDKTIKVCATEDPVCSDGMNFSAHNTYADDGAVIDKGVAFASSHLDAGTGGGATVASGRGGFGS
ncbi:cutinase family protein, partial [Mycobacterium nebraskense]